MIIAEAANRRWSHPGFWAPEKIRPESAISIKPISAFATRRIVKFAFDYAVAHHRRKVSAVAKANIMKFTDGLFLATAQRVAGEYPDIQFEDRIVGEREAPDLDRGYPHYTLKGNATQRHQDARLAFER